MSFTTSRFGVGDQSLRSGDGIPLDVHVIGEGSTSVDGVSVGGGILTTGVSAGLGSSLNVSFDRVSQQTLLLSTQHSAVLSLQRPLGISFVISAGVGTHGITTFTTAGTLCARSKRVRESLEGVCGISVLVKSSDRSVSTMREGIAGTDGTSVEDRNLTTGVSPGSNLFPTWFVSAEEMSRGA